VEGVRNYSCEDSAAKTAQGAVEVIDRLEPGMVVSFSFHAPGPDDRLVLGGQTITTIWCGRVAEHQTDRQLPSTVLSSGVSYHLELVGDQVVVL
jgi:hypothetical protein